MTDRQCGDNFATDAEKDAPPRIKLARRALQIARVLLLEEAQRQSNNAIYGAVMRATWMLDTQALLLTPKTATARFFDAGSVATLPATEKPRYEPFKHLIESARATGAEA